MIYIHLFTVYTYILFIQRTYELWYSYGTTAKLSEFTMEDI